MNDLATILNDFGELTWPEQCKALRQLDNETSESGGTTSSLANKAGIPLQELRAKLGAIHDYQKWHLIFTGRLPFPLNRV